MYRRRRCVEEYRVVVALADGKRRKAVGEERLYDWLAHHDGQTRRIRCECDAGRNDRDRVRAADEAGHHARGEQ